MTAEELHTLRAKLVKAIGSGTLELRNGDKLIRYQTTAEMIQALGALDKEIAESGGSVRTRSSFVQFSRG